MVTLRLPPPAVSHLPNHINLCFERLWGLSIIRTESNAKLSVIATQTPYIDVGIALWKALEPPEPLDWDSEL